MGLRIKSDKNKQLNISRYKYVVNIDTDEVILPANHTDWHAMMEHIEDISTREKIGGWTFNSTYFLDDMTKKATEGIPEYLHMMQHVYRSANYTKPGQYVKCFHNPQKALILHNHFPLGCLGGVCTSYPVDTGLAHLQHYRQDCVNTLKKSCANDFKSNSVKDTTIWKVKDTVIQRTNEALQKMGFFGSSPDKLQSFNSALP